MLIASEYFLNISMKNELLVFGNSGIVSVLEPRLNLKRVQSMYNAFLIKMQLYCINLKLKNLILMLTSQAISSFFFTAS